MDSENPWLDRRVLSFAHQGGALEAPSTTLFAMKKAAAAGANALELDVHATADGFLVCCHDPTVNRTTNGSGAIAEMTLRDVRALDNAYWFAPGHVTATKLDSESYVYRGRAPDDADFRIPTLSEVLDEFPGMIVNIDIKQTGPAVRPYEELLARVLADHGRSDDVIVASFHDSATAHFSTISPQIPTAAGTLAVASFLRALRNGEPLPGIPHAAFQVPVALHDTVIVDEDFVAAAHGAGVAVHVWTVDDVTEMARLVSLGVDGIMSDRPASLVAELDRLGAAWVP